MIGIRLLTPALRRKLKSPLGLLIHGSFTETMKRLKELIDEQKPPMLISVGDVVSNNVTKHGIQPEVLIVDNRVMRKAIAPIQVNASETLHVKNPPGTLTEEASRIIQEALKGGRQRVKVVVDGEEDLLTLLAVLHAPDNAFVVYGQPREGIVVIKVTEEKKEMVREIIEAMQPR